MARHYDPYDNKRSYGFQSFFERNCDEAWEEIKDTFVHGNKILIGLLAFFLAAALIGVVVLTFGVKAPTLRHKGADIGTEQGIDYGDGVQPYAGGTRKSDDYYTVLVLGRDTGGGGNTDTIMLASYDVTNQKATVMSIPRDTMVNVSWDIKRINSVYNYNGEGNEGIAALYKEISQLVGFEPDYQVIVEWEAVGQIVDAMGGVYFNVPRNMDYDDPYQDLSIHQTKGYRLLSGNDVMQVLRYRHDNAVNGRMLGYEDGDLGRIQTQQALLKSMIEQLLQIKNVAKIGDFAKVVKANVDSDLTFNEMLWFGKKAVLGGLTVENINFLTMPNTPTYAYSRTYNSYQSYVVPNAYELLDVVNNELSPYTEVFKLRDLDIMSVNEDGSLSSSTGYLEDSRAGVAPVIVKDEEGKTGEEEETIVDPEKISEADISEETPIGEAPIEESPLEEIPSEQPTEGMPAETEQPSEESQEENFPFFIDQNVDNY